MGDSSKAERGPSGLANVAARWESQQNVYRPERDSGLSALVECVSIASDAARPVVDLGCGTGSVTARVLARYPDSRVIGLDRDPVLLDIANSVFRNDHRVTLHRVDLADATWPECVHDQPRAVLTAAAIHWLDEAIVRSLYRQLGRLLPSGGVFANLDWFPVDARSLASWSAQVVGDRETRQLAEGAGMSWSQWWAELARQEDLREAFVERAALQLRPSAEFMRPAEWHQAELRAAGFHETTVIWRSFDSAVLVALR